MLMMHGLGFGLGATNYGAGPAIGTTGEVGWNDYGTPPPPPRPPTGGGGAIPTTCPTGYVMSAKGCITPTVLQPPVPGSTNPLGTRQPGQPAVPLFRCANGAMVTNPRLCAFGLAPDETKPAAGSPPGNQVNVVGADAVAPVAPKSKKGLILGVLAAGAGIAALAFFNR